jgi:hypothetical protein
MKSILLASASVFAFAGAAAADGHTSITFGGDATIGYNDLVEDGFFFDSGLSATMSAALDNGLTASATFGVDVANDATGIDLMSADWLLTLSSDMASLRFGKVDPAAEDMWSGVDGSSVTGFNDYDTHIDTAGFEAVLRGDVSYSGFDVAVSFGADVEGGNDLTGESIDALQAAAMGSFGAFGVMAAFQQEFGPTPQIIAVGATASFAGADLKVAYESDGTENSIGGSVSYLIGPVTLGGYYTQNEVAGAAFGASAAYASGPITVEVAYDVDAGADAGEGTVAADATYAVGSGITILAGGSQDLAADTTMFYGAGSYDLGGGATFLVVYADDGIDGNAGEDLGGPVYKEGITAQLSFSF